LRLLLAESTGATFGWTFDVEISGRPIACRKSSGCVPAIAISHSGGWVACAVASRGQVGIDIEVHRPGRDIMGIAGLAFGDGERRDVEREGVAAFYRIWTSREALAKARGRGLVEAADGIDRVAGAVRNGVRLRRIGSEEWWLIQAMPAQGLALALAFNGGPTGARRRDTLASA
jgi:phosphopantetheinyl transferase